MPKLNYDEELRYNLFTFLKLRCLELAEEDRTKDASRLAVAKRYFEWITRHESN